MKRHWYEAFGFSESFKRFLSIANIAVFLITFIFIFSEFRFDWIEHIIGNYLAATNINRPQTGALWESGRQTASAYDHLNKIISKKEESKKTIQQAGSFSELAAVIEPEEWITIGKNHFRNLYLALDKSAALKVVEPAQLVWILNSRSLERIFCEGIQDGIKIYFTNSDNAVIHQIELTKTQIDAVEKGEPPIYEPLEQIDGFENRIYPAKIFFDAVFTLPSDILSDLIVHPEILLVQDGTIHRVGIWNEAQNGYIRLGFEFEEKGEKKVVFTKGREWAVWQLSLNIKRQEP